MSPVIAVFIRDTSSSNVSTSKHLLLKLSLGPCGLGTGDSNSPLYPSFSL